LPQGVAPLFETAPRQLARNSRKASSVPKIKAREAISRREGLKPCRRPCAMEGLPQKNDTSAKASHRAPRSDKGRGGGLRPGPGHSFHMELVVGTDCVVVMVSAIEVGDEPLSVGDVGVKIQPVPNGSAAPPDKVQLKFTCWLNPLLGVAKIV